MVGAVFSRAAWLGADMPGTAFATPKYATSSFFNTFFGQTSEYELGLDLRALAGALLDEVLPGAMAPTTSPRSAVEFQLMRLRVREETGSGLAR